MKLSGDVSRYYRYLPAQYESKHKHNCNTINNIKFAKKTITRTIISNCLNEWFYKQTNHNHWYFKYKQYSVDDQSLQSLRPYLEPQSPPPPIYRKINKNHVFVIYKCKNLFCMEFNLNFVTGSLKAMPFINQL